MIEVWTDFEQTIDGKQWTSGGNDWACVKAKRHHIVTVVACDAVHCLNRDMLF